MNPIQVTTVSSKGQIVIPQEIRKNLGIVEGVKLIILTDGDHLLLKPIQSPTMKTFKALIKESRQWGKEKSLSPTSLQKTIKKVRHENRA